MSWLRDVRSGRQKQEARCKAANVPLYTTFYRTQKAKFDLNTSRIAEVYKDFFAYISGQESVAQMNEIHYQMYIQDCIWACTHKRKEPKPKWEGGETLEVKVEGMEHILSGVVYPKLQFNGARRADFAKFVASGSKLTLTILPTKNLVVNPKPLIVIGRKYSA